jgi:hypothetical protein
MQIMTSADALARACYNALLYCPKREPWAFALVLVTRGGVSLLTTDGYALARAECPALTPEDMASGVAFKIERADLEALETRARSGKKERLSLEFNMKTREIWYRGEDEEDDICMQDVFDESLEENSWDEINLDVFRELISAREVDPQTRRVILAPEYIRKIGQLKKDKNQGADFAFSGELDPALIKVGEGFWLIIQPIDRERHRAALGEEATW